ncbi:MAG: phosphoribosylanthranilate isomerase, partial [Bacteroidota bacterium]
MKIKVCGTRDRENLKNILALKPDFVGFIFYEKSPRFVSEMPDVE